MKPMSESKRNVKLYDNKLTNASVFKNSEMINEN